MITLKFLIWGQHSFFYRVENIILGSKSLWCWAFRGILFVVLNYPGICTILYWLWLWRSLIIDSIYLLSVAFFFFSHISQIVGYFVKTERHNINDFHIFNYNFNIFNIFYLNIFTYDLILIIMENIEYFLKKVPQILQVYYFSLRSNFF